jgi:transposase
MTAKYVRPYSKGQKNDYRDAEAIAEVVHRPTMKFVATKTADQLDVQALHRVRERLVSQRTGIINQIRAFLLERGARPVRAGGLGCVDQAEELGTLRAQALDRSRQEAAAPQRARDRAG